jgi:hypothetical protein
MLRTRFILENIQPYPHSNWIRLSLRSQGYEDAVNDEQRAAAVRDIPAGSLEMVIVNENIEQFVVGRGYYVELVPIATDNDDTEEINGSDPATRPFR